jgi:hypothetical protein
MDEVPIPVVQAVLLLFRVIVITRFFVASPMSSFPQICLQPALPLALQLALSYALSAVLYIVLLPLMLASPSFKVADPLIARTQIASSLLFSV